MRGGCLKYLKRGWNRKEGRETKILKRAASWVKRLEVGVLKGGTGTPLETMTP